MKPGFSVETLVPCGRGSGPLRMGLARVTEAEWLWPEFDRSARVAAFDAHPDAICMEAGAEAAAAECARMVAGMDDFAVAARTVWEDLCVCQADADGTYRLTAAAVAFPTDWRLSEKFGQPLDFIHRPIHGYAEQLSAGVNHFFATLKPDQIFGRANWFVMASDALRYLPDDDPATRFAHVTADNAGDTLFARCERQTLRRLPETGAVLFTIGVAVEPLANLPADMVAFIADALTAQPDGEHERRAAPFYADGLARYASRRNYESETPQ